MISISRVEYRDNKAVLYRITLTENICGKTNTRGFDAHSREAVHKAIDHYFDATGSNTHPTIDPECPLCNKAGDR